MGRFSHALKSSVKLPAKPFPMGGRYAFRMDDIYEIRRKNLAALLTSPALGGLSQKEQAIALDQSPSMLSQLKAGKRIGDDVARKIEAAQKKPANWLDNTHRQASQPARLEAGTLKSAIQLAKRTVEALTGKDDFDPEEDADLLAQAVNAVLAEDLTTISDSDVLRFLKVKNATEGDRGKAQRTGQAGGIGGAAGEAEAGGEGEPARRRARKSA